MYKLNYLLVIKILGYCNFSHPNIKHGYFKDDKRRDIKRFFKTYSKKC